MGGTGWTTTAPRAELVVGALELETTEHGLLPHRLPARARAQGADDQLRWAESQPSGVRVRFRSRATAIELDTLRTRLVYPGNPPRPDGVYDLLLDGEPTARASTTGGRRLVMDLATGVGETLPGPVGTVRFTGLPSREKLVEIWLPHTEVTELVALRTDAPVDVAPPPAGPVWVHHGSSISHGSNAASPIGTWPAHAARLSGANLVNLGFGGSALLDPFVARTIAATPADLISLKLGINLVNTDLMRRRALVPAVHGFLDTIRDARPTTPLLVVSPIFCAIHEDAPGPTAPELTASGLRFRATGDPAEVAAGKLTLRVIRAELSRVVAERAADDPHLHHLDGTELYGAADAVELPLPDALHPDAAAHLLIGQRFAAAAFAAGGPFGSRTTTR